MSTITDTTIPTETPIETITSPVAETAPETDTDTLASQETDLHVIIYEALTKIELLAHFTEEKLAAFVAEIKSKI